MWIAGLLLSLVARLIALEPTAEEAGALRTAQQGDVLVMPALAARHRELLRVPVQIASADGPQLLLSDKPEYFLTGDGISLREKVNPGLVRLYIYHVPVPSGRAETISAVLENLGQNPLTLDFLRRAFPRPGKDYNRIGKSGLLEFFAFPPPERARQVPAGGRIVIDEEMDSTRVSTDELVHGFYEFEIDQPAQVTVFERDPQQISTNVIDTLPKLPLQLPGKPIGNGAGRGLFVTSDFTVTNSPGFVLDTTNGAMQLVLADGRRDPWIRGHDSLDGIETHDSGNYGVLYRIRLTRASSDGRGLALLLGKFGSPGRYCGRLAAAMQVSAGVWPAGTVALPAKQNAFGEPGEMALAQRFAPLAKGRTEVIELIYSPPGASCIPTPLLFVPY